MAKTIWVVDDEQAVRDTLESMIKQLGHEVRSFSTGENALSAFQQSEVPPDVIITDVRLPGMRGMDLTRAILDIDPETIMIMLTAYPSIEDAVESIRAGAADFLSKPCRLEELRVRLEHVLECRDLQARLGKVKMLVWGLIVSLPIWFSLGVLLARILRS
jgi:DNA-binding NtrC family response regulator